MMSPVAFAAGVRGLVRLETEMSTNVVILVHLLPSNPIRGCASLPEAAIRWFVSPMMAMSFLLSL